MMTLPQLIVNMHATHSGIRMLVGRSFDESTLDELGLGLSRIPSLPFPPARPLHTNERTSSTSVRVRVACDLYYVVSQIHMSILG